MNWLVCLLALAALFVTVTSGASEGSRAGVYSAEGGAIVGRNLKRYNNRPLYSNKLPTVVLTGDLPLVRLVHEPYICGCLIAAIERGGKAKWLHDFADVVSRYHDARMTWELSDPSFPRLTVVFEAVPLAEGPGFCARLSVRGAKPGDRLIWACGGLAGRPQGFDRPLGSGSVAAAFDATSSPECVTRGFVPEDCKGNTLSIDGDTFAISPPAAKNRPMVTVAGRCSASSAATISDANAWADPVALIATEKADLPLVAGSVPLDANGEVFWAIERFGGEKIGDIARLRDPAASFRAAIGRAEGVARQVVVDTPDERFDASVSAVCAAVNGLIQPPYIMHGTMNWNVPYMGWRTMYGPTALGWHDAVRTTAAMYLTTQEKTDTKKAAHADPGLGYTAEAADSRFYGLGRLTHNDNHFYDMQSVLYDMVIHAWRWTGDAELERHLSDTLALHIRWMTDCFDPDGDGLYESYENTAEVDQVWYNGGGSAEETAYAYNACVAAVDLARKAGDEKSAVYHEALADRIKRALMRKMWVRDKGYVGAYVEQGGLERLHEDSWLYSIFLPIDARMLTEQESAQALHYTEWGLERVKMPLGGELCWTSNWIPTAWSNRMLWQAQAYSLSLAYCQAGLPDDAWNAMIGGFLESCFNKRVAGGVDNETVGTDFHDASSMFARAVVEGTFGYVPDYPNGVVRCAPQFPSKWDHASIKAPDFSLSFKHEESVDNYTLKLAQPAEVAFSVPVRAGRVVSATVDGKAAAWESAPGYGCSIVSVKLSRRKTARLTITCADPLPQFNAVHVACIAGEPVELKAKDGRVLEVADPQRVLSNPKIEGGAVKAVLTRSAGDHMVFARVEVGELQQWRIFKLKVTDPRAEAEAAARLVDKIPADAKWTSVSVKDQLNGDIRTIYSQEYLSPRPQTCSLRIGVSGYHSWPFYYWGAKSPKIDVANVEKMLDPGGRLVTPQGVPFEWSGGERNIAFTSRWDNWPRSVTIPVGRKGKAVWLLVCGSTNQMQGKIANAEFSLRYSDGGVDKLELLPPFNFWSLCGMPNGEDYDLKRDAFVLAGAAPATVQLGTNCRAILLNRRLREDATLESLTLETLSQEVVIGLMGVTVME